MQRTPRPAAAGIVAALAVALAACSGSGPAPGASGATSPPAASALDPAASATGTAGGGATRTADVFGPRCATAGVRAMDARPLATAVAAAPLLSTLTTAIGTANLRDVLNEQPGATVFAPDDDAFAALRAAMGDAAYTALLADPTRLGTLLEYHVSGTRLAAADLLAAGRSSELTDGDVTVGGSVAGGVTVTDGRGGVAKVLCGDIPTSNATVFVIDRVLVPKS